MKEQTIRLSVSVDAPTLELLKALKRLCNEQGTRYVLSEAVRRALALAYSTRPDAITNLAPLEISTRMQIAVRNVNKLATSIATNGENDGIIEH